MIKATGINKDIKWKCFNDIVNSLTESYQYFSKVKDDMPDASLSFSNEKIARQTLRFSGRTAINTNISVNEPKPPGDDDSPLVFSMEGYKGITPSSYIVPYYWSPGWNSAQAMNKYLDEPAGSMKYGDPGVRLLDEKGGQLSDFFKEIPDPFKPESGKFLVIPYNLIFGSEELSSGSKSVSELIPEPFLLINESEKIRLRTTENNKVKLTINQVSIIINIKIENTVPDGIACLSLLQPGIPFMNLPSWGRIEIEKSGL